MGKAVSYPRLSVGSLLTFTHIRPVPFGSLRFPLSTSRTDMKEVKVGRMKRDEMQRRLKDPGT